MEALGGGNGGFLGWGFPPRKPKQSKSQRRNVNSSESVDATGGTGFHFPLKQALTAGSLSLTGDTLAQLIDRWKRTKALKQNSASYSGDSEEDSLRSIFMDHDWLRALRMMSYGFILYGPGSHAWYQYLEHCMPKQTVGNIMMKVLLNQIVLGPCVIAVVFAWNNLWLGKISELPNKYRKDALSTLLYGFRFWVPASALNFWVVPLQTRVAYMSTCSIFWNFYLSSTMSK